MTHNRRGGGGGGGGGFGNLGSLVKLLSSYQKYISDIVPVEYHQLFDCVLTCDGILFYLAVSLDILRTLLCGQPIRVQATR